MFSVLLKSDCVHTAANKSDLSSHQLESICPRMSPQARTVILS